MNHVVGAGEVEAGAARLDGEDHEGDIFLPVEFLHHLLAALHASAPVQNESLRVENLFEVSGEVFRDLPVLSKDKDAFALLVNGLADVAEHGKFPALLRVVGLLPEELVGMVADLL